MEQLLHLYMFIYIYILLFIKIYNYLHSCIFSYILNSCIENFNFCKYTYLLVFKDIYIYIHLYIFFLIFAIKIYLQIYGSVYNYLSLSPPPSLPLPLSLSHSLSLVGEYAAPSLYSSSIHSYIPRFWPFLLYFFEQSYIGGGSQPRLHRSSNHSLQYLIDCDLDCRFPSTYLSLLSFWYYFAIVRCWTTWWPACQRITLRPTRCPSTFVQ